MTTTKAQLEAELDRARIELSLYADRLTVTEGDALRAENRRLATEVERFRSAAFHLNEAARHMNAAVGFSFEVTK